MPCRGGHGRRPRAGCAEEGAAAALKAEAAAVFMSSERQFGFLGTEFLAEGPLSKKNKSSYLVMGRYSTLSLFQQIGIKIGTDAVPQYGDASFKFNFPLNDDQSRDLDGSIKISANTFIHNTARIGKGSQLGVNSIILSATVCANSWSCVENNTVPEKFISELFKA
mgnify:CR=1 FL=1